MIGSALVLMCREPLNALTLGEEGARALGIDLNRVRWMLCIGMGLLVGASVAVTGIIGFVGLVVPHLLRPSSAPGHPRCSFPARSEVPRSCSLATLPFACCQAARSCSWES